MRIIKKKGGRVTFDGQWAICFSKESNLEMYNSLDSDYTRFYIKLNAGKRKLAMIIELIKWLYKKQ